MCHVPTFIFELFPHKLNILNYIKVIWNYSFLKKNKLFTYKSNQIKLIYLNEFTN